MHALLSSLTYPVPIMCPQMSHMITELVLVASHTCPWLLFFEYWIQNKETFPTNVLRYLSKKLSYYVKSEGFSLSQLKQALSQLKLSNPLQLSSIKDKSNISSTTMILNEKKSCLNFLLFFCDLSVMHIPIPMQWQCYSYK